MEAEASASTTYSYDTLPPLSLFPETDPPPIVYDSLPALSLAETEPAGSYSIFRSQITAAAGDSAEIPSAEFFSLDVAALTPVPEDAAVLSASKQADIAGRPAAALAPEKGWFRAGCRFKSPMLQLHKEILEFCDFISPTPEEQASRAAAVECVSDVIKHIWPQCKVEVFGSFKTGLYLPTSDIDVVILESKVKTPQIGLYALAKALSQQSIAKKIQVIAKARVPIIKFVEKISGIAFDISFDVDSGPTAADFMKDAVRKLPPLRPLSLILKVFLQQRELNEVYSGGIGSYALLAMLIAHLQMHWRGQDLQGHHQLREQNLGILLVSFFDFFGRKLNNYDVGVSCNSNKTFFLKSDIGFSNNERAYLLSIQDPQAPDNDIGKNSFNYYKVKSAFAMAYSILTDANSIIKLGSERSILGLIIRPDSVLLDRKGGNNGEITFNSMLAGAGDPVITPQFENGNDIAYNWQLMDDEPLPRGNLVIESKNGLSNSSSKKKKLSKLKKRLVEGEKSEGKIRVSKKERGGKEEERDARSFDGNKRRKGNYRDFDRFTNSLPRYSGSSRW